MDQASNPSRRFATPSLAVYIYAFIVGAQQGALGSASLQAIEFLVSFELGYEGKNKTSGGPCSGEQANTTGSDEANALIQEQTSSVAFVGAMLGGLPALLVVIVLSTWSDGARSYRQLRFVAVLPCIGMTLYMAVYVVVLALRLSPWLTLLASTFMALGGGVYLQFAMMTKYLIYVNAERERAVYIIYLQILSFSAQGFSQLGTGYLIEGAGFITPFVILFFICLGTTVFVAIYPPIIEAKPTTDDQPKRGGVLTMCRDILAVFRDPDTGECNTILALYCVSLLIYMMLTIYFLILVQIYVLGTPFCWSPSLIGYFGVAKLVSCATVVLFGCFRILPGAVITASVSKHAKKQHFGSLFGVTMAIESLASSLAPIIFGSIYTLTVADDPQFVFKLMAGLAVIPSTLIMCIQCWNMTSGVANYTEYKEGALLASSGLKK
ncbi:proton-coupled folate transporter-like isoform X2 [Asterias rubens]|uniref:proton-coupled folate transporter-like isoform X2 n=1 Tax=Asterias rubens TaxID=7604 RepID=UPI001455B97C|nr:proton-coupled folate transporter-like isoform X2 [Asterias rubens]